MSKKPLYTITDKATEYLGKIIEIITHLKDSTEFERNIRLHRENRLKTIHSSMAIEGNTLSFEEVSAVLEGKRVVGKKKDIDEVKNAYKAYDKIATFNPYSIKDFLTAHKYMMKGIISEAGQFRSGDVGIFSGDTVIHIGARPQYVPQLITDLFCWAKKSDLHPILKSGVLHYEIETIHPFADGNGRMGRFWQTLMLTKWNSIFAWIPMEAVLYQNRDEYYKSLAEADRKNDSAGVIEFTLYALYESIKNQTVNQVKNEDMTQEVNQEKDNPVEIRILKILIETPLSAKEIFDKLGIYKNTRTVKKYIAPLIKEGLIEMTIPDIPNSKFQKYRLTEQGKDIINNT